MNPRHSVDWNIHWANFRANWREYTPTYIAFALHFGLVVGMMFETPSFLAYISDLFDANTWAELGGAWAWGWEFSWGLWKILGATLGLAIFLIQPLLRGRRRLMSLVVLACLLLLLYNPWLFRTGENYHFSALWALTLLFLFLVGNTCLQVLFALNVRVAQELHAPPPHQPDSHEALEGETPPAESPAPRPKKFLRLLDVHPDDIALSLIQSSVFQNPTKGRMTTAHATPNRLFFRLLFFACMMTQFPTFALVALSLFVAIPATALALVGTACLLLLLLIMPPLGRLGIQMGASWWIPRLTWVPLIGFLLTLFAPPYGWIPVQILVPVSVLLVVGALRTTHPALDRWSSLGALPFAFAAFLVALPEGGTEIQKPKAGAKPPGMHSSGGYLFRAQGATSRPLIIFCASGGGSRAAMFTAGVLLKMQNSPQGRLLLENADILSGVSGGGLALAYFQARLYEEVAKQPNTPAVQANVRRNALNWLTASLTPPAEGETLEQCLQRYDDAPFMKDMRRNHLAACFSGFFRRLEGRGPALENEWGSKFKWVKGEKEDLRLSDLLAFETERRLPTLMLNATLTETGARIALTNLPARDFAPLKDFGEPKENATFFGDDNKRFDPLPGRVNTLNDLAPYWDISLKQAARASANFPAAMPTIRFLDKNSRLLEMIDGGLIDNLALDSALSFLRRNVANLQAPPLMQTAAELQGRPVLIFLMDASYMPLNPKRPIWDGLAHHFTEFQLASARATQNNEAIRNSLYLSELSDLLGSSPKPIYSKLKNNKDFTVGYSAEGSASGEVPWAFFTVRCGKLQEEQVITYWHLNQKQRCRLYRVLDAPEQQEAIRLAGQWVERHIKRQ